MNKTRLMIFYDWFYPGYRAGGPIQSLTNLVLALHQQLEIYVVTGLTDLNSKTPYSDVVANEWTNIKLPGAQKAIKVYYASGGSLKKEIVNNIITNISPDIVYLNGIYSYRYFLLPLFVLRKSVVNCKIIVCPRGMLKRGALASKRIKKKIYLQYLRFSNLLNQASWHATTAEEAEDIHIHFPVNKGVTIAPNIPKVPYANVTDIIKRQGELKMVYLSLINNHKNLLLLLQLMQRASPGIVLDIYGPIVDEEYWEQCQPLLQQLKDRVSYKGPVQPANVQQVLSKYHVLILLTKGENFGHAIYECLSVGRPVITSKYTPWNELGEKQAGANVVIESAHDCLNALNFFLKMDQLRFNEYCLAAHANATSYFDSLNPIPPYKLLFG